MRPDVTISASNRLGRAIRYVDIEVEALPCTAVVAAKKWGREKSAALEREQVAKQAYFERTGLAEQYRIDREAFIENGEKWRTEKREACERSFGERRRYGDNRILEALEMCEVVYDLTGKEPHKLTPAFKDILAAVIKLCKDSGVLFASASSIARKAGRSKSSVDTYMKKLEDLYILNRKSSGGKNMKTGKTTSNRYEINYDTIRVCLRVGMWSEEDTKKVFEKAIRRRAELKESNKAHWSGRGYARHSESQRAKQRREERAKARTSTNESVKKTPTYFTDSTSDIGFDQQFWAVSLQSTKKEQKIETLRVFHKLASLQPTLFIPTGTTKNTLESQSAGRKERIESKTCGVLPAFMHSCFSDIHSDSLFMHEHGSSRIDCAEDEES